MTDISALPIPSRPCNIHFFDSSDPLFSKEKPYYSNIPFFQSGAPNSNVQAVNVKVPVFNIRGFESSFSLDKNGFELVKWSLDVPDWYDGPAVAKDVYPAVGRLLEKRLGDGARAVIYDHTLRRSDASHEDLSLGIQGDSSTSATFARPSRVAHNDQTYQSTIEQIKLDFGPEAEDLLSKRFRIINVWKPLKAPVRQYPLVLCDSRTCIGDGNPCDLVYPHTVTENIIFAHSEKQRWYYVENQADDEVWMIKIMDSASRDDPAVAENAAHTSFFDEDPALADEVRVSVEFRAYVFGG